MTQDRNAELIDGTASNDNGEYYRVYWPNGPNTDVLVFGCCVFQQQQGLTERTTGRTVRGYDLWMVERHGIEVERITYEESTWSDIDERRESEGLA